MAKERSSRTGHLCASFRSRRRHNRKRCRCIAHASGWLYLHRFFALGGSAKGAFFRFSLTVVLCVSGDTELFQRSATWDYVHQNRGHQVPISPLPQIQWKSPLGILQRVLHAPAALAKARYLDCRDEIVEPPGTIKLSVFPPVRSYNRPLPSAVKCARLPHCMFAPASPLAG